MTEQTNGHLPDRLSPDLSAHLPPASVAAARQYVFAAQHTAVTYICMAAGILAIGTIVSIPNTTLTGLILITVILFLGLLATVAWTNRVTARQLTHAWFVDAAQRDLAMPGRIPARTPGDSDLAWAKAILAATNTTTGR